MTSKVKRKLQKLNRGTLIADLSHQSQLNTLLTLKVSFNFQTAQNIKELCLEEIHLAKELFVMVMVLDMRVIGKKEMLMGLES